MHQLTEQEAVALHDSGAWEHWPMFERAAFQMAQDRLCMPFSVFHEAVEKSVGRPVYTHEFGLNRDGLIKELLGEKAAPSMQEILEMIPAEKRIVIVAP